MLENLKLSPSLLKSLAILVTAFVLLASLFIINTCQYIELEEELLPATGKTVKIHSAEHQWIDVRGKVRNYAYLPQGTLAVTALSPNTKLRLSYGNDDGLLGRANVVDVGQSNKKQQLTFTAEAGLHTRTEKITYDIDKLPHYYLIIDEYVDGSYQEVVRVPFLPKHYSPSNHGI